MKNKRSLMQYVTFLSKMDFETESSKSSDNFPVGKQLYGSTFEFIASDGAARTALVACNFNLWEKRFFPLAGASLGEYILPTTHETVVTWDGMKLSINSSDNCRERMVAYLWAISLCRSSVPIEDREQVRFYIWVQFNMWDIPSNGHLSGNGSGATDALFNSLFSASRMRIVSFPNAIPFASTFEHGGVNVFPDLAFGRVCQNSVRRYISYCCNPNGFLPIVPSHSLQLTTCGKMMYGDHSVDIRRVGQGQTVENTLEETIESLKIPYSDVETRMTAARVVGQTKLNTNNICVTNYIQRTVYPEVDFQLATDNGLVEFNISMETWASHPQNLIRMVDALIMASYPGPSDTQVQIVMSDPEVLRMPLSVAAYIVGSEDLPPDVRFCFEFEREEHLQCAEDDSTLWVHVHVGLPNRHQIGRYIGGDYDALHAETVGQGINVVKSLIATYACVPPVAMAAFQRFPTAAVDEE